MQLHDQIGATRGPGEPPSPDPRRLCPVLEEVDTSSAAAIFPGAARKTNIKHHLR